MLGLKLYRLSESEFVGEDVNGLLWHFPARKGGWNARLVYGGSTDDLLPLARTNARGTRWPGTGSTSGPKVKGSGVSTSLTLSPETVELIGKLSALPDIGAKVCAVTQAIEMLAKKHGLK